jgi:alginate O-acetyltransferase complex protein AlgI
LLFTEFRFLVFFVLVFVVHWATSASSLRKVWLLLSSYAFYAAWDWRFLGLIVASTTIDYTVGLLLGRVRADGRRRILLGASVVGNLSILGFFKYYNFFVGSAADLLRWLGADWGLETLEIILPVGISFYTFQTLSYTIDVYRGKIEPTRNLLDVALFVGFFPQLVAGPIVRAADFLPQLRTERRFGDVDVRGNLRCFLVGFIKKACIADNLAAIVDVYFQDPHAYTAGSAWIAVLLYAIQIYCDFSGYSDMAVGGAGLLGYRLPENFSFPYLAANITEFWRRWHISLSTWLRDYLYIPLGGNRHGKLRATRNLLVTMLIGGLWHGAAWNFVAWGGMHGLMLIAHKEWVRRLPRWRVRGPLTSALSPLLTFYWVCLGWILFRSESFSSAWATMESFVLLQSPGPRELSSLNYGLILILAIVHWASQSQLLADVDRRLPDWAFAVVYGAAAAATLSFVSIRYTPFIYFQF